MTSKENIERIDNAIKEHLSEQCYMIWNSIKKDLEDYEELKKVMGTPIQEIMKRLKVLEILKRVIFLTNNSYYIQTKKRLNEEDYKLIKEWLDGK